MKSTNSNQEKLRDCSEEWPSISITQELDRAYAIFGRLGKTAAVFGGSRVPRDHVFYDQAFNVGYNLSKRGVFVITGGGAGIMEAANKGAYSHNPALSCAVFSGFAREPDDVVYTRFYTKTLNFNHLMIRKFVFLRCAQVFIAMPGAFGTLDEIFEVLVYKQREPHHDCIVILWGRGFWAGLLEWLKSVVDCKFLLLRDVSMLSVVDSWDELYALLLSRGFF